MRNTYGSLLIAILVASSACLASESAQSQPQVAIITGEIRNPTSREITFSYQPPSAIGSAEERVVLDSLNYFALEIPVVRGALARGYYDSRQPKWMQWIGYFLFDHSPFIFFVEPGDSLHIVVEEGFFSPSYSFSGPNADNSRLIADFLPRFSSSLDYEDLEVDDFKRQIDQRRRDEFAFLAEGREKYALSPVFIDYATTFFNYEWAKLMISYPTNYRFANGHRNRAIPPEYYDFLQEIPLGDEKAIGVGNYHTFLERTLDWESERPKLPRRPSGSIGPLPSERRELGEVPRRSWQLSERSEIAALELSEETLAQLDSIYAKGEWTTWNFSKRYDLAKEKLEGRVLYWFLAEEVISGFESGSEAFALAHRKWKDFQEINPYPEYTEAVQAALDKALKLQPGQPAPEFTLDDLDGQPVSLSQFKGQVVLLDFWASWCGPCISDLPNLRRIKEKTATLPVVFLNVSIDTDEAAWREAIDKHEIKGVHVRANGFSSDVAKSYQVTGIPSYYLVDSQGLILENPIIRDTDEIVATIEKSL